MGRADVFLRENRKLVIMFVYAHVSDFLYFSFFLHGHDIPLEKGLW